MPTRYWLVGRSARDGVSRLEAEALEFHQRVRDGFRSLAAADPGRYAVLDAGQEPDQVQADVRAAVDRVLATRADLAD